MLLQSAFVTLTDTSALTRTALVLQLLGNTDETPSPCLYPRPQGKSPNQTSTLFESSKNCFSPSELVNTGGLQVADLVFPSRQVMLMSISLVEKSRPASRSSFSLYALRSKTSSGTSLLWAGYRSYFWSVITPTAGFKISLQSRN